MGEYFNPKQKSARGESGNTGASILDDEGTSPRDQDTADDEMLRFPGESDEDYMNRLSRIMQGRIKIGGSKD